jgi:hypothetical protein
LRRPARALNAGERGRSSMTARLLPALGDKGDRPGMKRERSHCCCLTRLSGKGDRIAVGPSGGIEAPVSLLSDASVPPVARAGSASHGGVPRESAHAARPVAAVHRHGVDRAYGAERTDLERATLAMRDEQRRDLPSVRAGLGC